MKSCFSVLLVVLWGHEAVAAILHVPSEYPTIQSAIDAAVAGDTVLVADGTYNTTSGESFPIVMKSGVFLQSRNGRDYSTIDAEGTAGVIYCSACDSNTTIEGFTITGGNATGLNGGGVTLRNDSPTIVRANRITNNSTQLYGGGIFSEFSSPSIEDNEILFNTAGYNGGGIQISNLSSPIIQGNEIAHNSVGLGDGGGIKIWTIGFCGSPPANPIVKNNSIHDNVANDKGGGIYQVTYPGTGEIKNNLIFGNSAYGADATHSNRGPGGGIYVEYSTALIANNVVFGNYAESPLSSIVAAGIGANNVNPCDGGHPIITNNIIYGNSNGFGIYCQNGSKPAISYNDVARNQEGSYRGCTPGNGDISVDPEFCDTLNFVLRPTSVCIDAGDPGIVDGAARCPRAHNGPRSDMGAYGGPDNVGWESCLDCSGATSLLTSPAPETLQPD